MDERSDMDVSAVIYKKFNPHLGHCDKDFCFTNNICRYSSLSVTES